MKSERRIEIELLPYIKATDNHCKIYFTKPLKAKIHTKRFAFVTYVHGYSSADQITDCHCSVKVRADETKRRDSGLKKIRKTSSL